MRAVTFQKPGEVRVESVPEPLLEAPGDVVVEVTATAICGSDLHPYQGRELGLDRGTVLGHEFVGTVVKTGAAVTRLRAGTRVAAPFSTSCGACFFCRAGLTSRCPQGQLFGWVEGGRGLHGGQAGRVRVPLAESTLLPLPNGVSDEEALLLGDVLSTAFFCADGAGAGPGGVFVVLGCGPVGLLSVLACLEKGAARVLAVDGVDARLQLAAALGAEPLHLQDDDLVAAVHRASGGRGADGVLEAVGSPAASRLALDLVRSGGVISAAGVHTEPAFAFTPGEVYDRNLTYTAGRCPARAYMEKLLPMVLEKRHDLAVIFSHRMPLEAAADGYRLFSSRQAGCTKVLLTP